MGMYSAYYSSKSGEYGKTTITGNAKDSIYILVSDKFYGKYALPAKIDIGNKRGIGKIGKEITAISSDGSMKATSTVKTKFYTPVLLNFIPRDPLIIPVGMITFTADMKDGYTKDCEKITDLTFLKTNNSAETLIEFGKQQLTLSSAGKTEFDHAISLFDKAHAIDKDYLKNNEWLALYSDLGDTAMIKFKDLNDAMLCYKKACILSDITPEKEFEFWNEHGNKYLKQGFGNEAISCYRAAYSVVKMSAIEGSGYWRNLAGEFVQASQVPHAITCYKKSYDIAVTPDVQRFSEWLERGEKYLNNNDADNAMLYFAEAEKINSKDNLLKQYLLAAENIQTVKWEREEADKRQRKADEQDARKKEIDDINARENFRRKNQFGIYFDLLYPEGGFSPAEGVSVLSGDLGLQYTRKFNPYFGWTISAGIITTTATIHGDIPNDYSFASLVGLTGFRFTTGLKLAFYIGAQGGYGYNITASTYGGYKDGPSGGFAAAADLGIAYTDRYRLGIVYSGTTVQGEFKGMPGLRLVFWFN
jgi:tetratricopeptide (TPR) repeat protein